MCEVVGFIDDDPLKAYLILQGKPVLGTGEALVAAVRTHAVKRVLIAVPSATGPQMVRILKLALDAGAEYKMVPGLGTLFRVRIWANRFGMSLSKTYSAEGRSISTRAAFASASREKSSW